MITQSREKLNCVVVIQTETANTKPTEAEVNKLSIEHLTIYY